MSDFQVTRPTAVPMSSCLDRSHDQPRTACPREGLWNDLTSKWSIQVLAVLAETGRAPRRFRQVLRRIDGISVRVLASTLRTLERDGLVERHDLGGYPSHVEYQLTKPGVTFLAAMDAVVHWMSDAWPAVTTARAAYDGRRTTRA